MLGRANWPKYFVPLDKGNGRRGRLMGMGPICGRFGGLVKA